MISIILVLGCLGAALHYAGRAHAAGAEYKPYVIWRDAGGDPNSYITHFGALREANIPVEIRGACLSACTIVLELPPTQVCIAPDARLGFHMAETLREGGLYFEADPEYTRDFIERFYPKPVQDWLKTQILPVGIYLSGEQLIQMGVFPACGT